MIIEFLYHKYKNHIYKNQLMRFSIEVLLQLIVVHLNDSIHQQDQYNGCITEPYDFTNKTKVAILVSAGTLGIFNLLTIWD